MWSGRNLIWTRTWVPRCRRNATTWLFGCQKKKAKCPSLTRELSEGGLACQVSGLLHWHRSFGLEVDAPPVHGHGVKGQDALYDPADFRALIEQRDEIHQQRAQTTLKCPLKDLEEALKTVGDNGEHEPASSQADTNRTF